MSETLQSAGTVCSVLIAAELLAKLCPKDQMLSFVRALVALVLIASLVSSAASASWEWPEDLQEVQASPELMEYMEDQYAAAARDEVEGYVRGLLEAAGIEAKKIRADIHINEDNSISCTKVSLTFAYESEAGRARAVLGSVLEGMAVEVSVDGG